MKNVLSLLAILVFSISNAQKCKFEIQDLDDTAEQQIAITKPRLITPTSIGNTEYIFAKGGKIENDAFLILDFRANKKFTIDSECKIVFNTENSPIEVNFNEFKIAYFNDIGDHSSYWKLKTRIPIDSVFINTISSNRITSIKWDTTEESFEKKLKGKHNKNINKLLYCLNDETAITPPNNEEEQRQEEEIAETPKETPEKLPETLKVVKTKEKIQEKETEEKIYVKSKKEIAIEQSIVIPVKEK